MSYINHLTVKTKIGLLVVVFLLALIGNGIYASMVRQKVQLDGPLTQKVIIEKDVYADASPPTLFLRGYHLTLYQMQDAQDAASLEKLNADRQRLQGLFNRSYEEWNQKLPVGPLKTALQLVYETGTAYLGAVERDYVPVRRAGQLPEARAMLAQRINPLYDQHAEAIQKFLNVAEQRNSETLSDVQKINAQESVVSITVVSVTTLILLILAVFLTHSITGALEKTVGTLAGTSAELAATVQQQEQTSLTQFAAVHETTTTMDELEASFRQTADLVKFGAETARQSQEAAQSGVVAVNRTISGMESMRVRVDDIASHILSLSQLTGQIGTITGLVGDLSSQTNMLALNAAVEAARAGEHGRGFAVVASEIRKLADESRRSAERIAALVEQIQRETDSTVLVTEEGSKTVERGINQAQELAQTFESVARASREASDSAQQTLLTVPQQVAAVQQVLGAMESLNSGAREATSGLTLTRSGIERLRAAADNLKSLV
jgi:methyl-accepting chemotaxis protein